MALRKRKDAYHHDDLRPALVAAAVKLISREGASALTLREVARMAGVSHAAPYRHFADKESLVAAVAEEGFRGLHAQMTERMQGKGDPARALTECGIAYVEYALAHPAHFQVMFTGRLLGNEALDAAAGDAFGVLLEAAREGQRLEVFKGADAMHAATASWSVVHGLATLLVEGRVPTPDDPAALARKVVRTCLEGLLR